MKSKSNGRIRGMHRQGDVLVFGDRKLPAGHPLPRGRDGRVVLAEGETTGHFHAIDAKPGVCELYADDSVASVPDAMQMLSGLIPDRVLVIAVDKAPPLTHDEHSAHVITKGNKTVRIQMQWDPTTMGVRNVAD